MAQTHNSIAILGMPIDNLNMDETVEHIFAMIDGYQKDQRPRQVATVNVDFVVNTLSWSLKHIRHPELLDILRRADLVTPDGMPIVWVSRFLGVPLTQDPWRLWKRYFVGFFKFGLMVLPAILYYRYRRFLFNRLHKRILTPDIKPSSLNIIETLPIKVVTLSDPLDAAATKLVKEELKDIAKESINVVLDLSRITFIDSSGIGLLVSLRRGLQNEDKDLFLIGIGASVKRLFTLSRVIDLFEDKICDNIDEVLAKTVNMEALSPFYYIEQVRYCLIYLER